MKLKPKSPASHTLLQVDVEGSELEVLQGVQPSDWANVHQVCQYTCLIHAALAGLQAKEHEGSAMLSSAAPLAADLSCARAKLGAGSFTSMHLPVLAKVQLNAVLATC